MKTRNNFKIGRYEKEKKRGRRANVIKLMRRAKNHEKEQVIEKIACSFFCTKKKKGLDKQVEMCGEAP